MFPPRGIQTTILYEEMASCRLSLYFVVVWLKPAMGSPRRPVPLTPVHYEILMFVHSSVAPFRTEHISSYELEPMFLPKLCRMNVCVSSLCALLMK